MTNRTLNPLYLVIALHAGCAIPNGARPERITDDGGITTPIYPGYDAGAAPDLAPPLSTLPADGTVFDGVMVSGVVPDCPDSPVPHRTDRSLLVDPVIANSLWVGVEGRGFYHSADGGFTWAKMVHGFRAHLIADTEQFCFDRFYTATMDPQQPNHLCVGMQGTPGTLADPITAADGVYCTNDAGLRWQQLASKTMNTATSAVAIDPTTPDTIYAGVLGITNGAGQYFQETGVVYVTINAGGAWPELDFGSGFVPGMTVSDLRVSPYGQHAIYAGVPVFNQNAADGHAYDGPQSGVMASYDSGANWASLTRGMGAANATRAITGITLSVTNPDRMIVSTPNAPPAQPPYFYWSSDGGNNFAGPVSQPALPLDLFAFDPGDPSGRHAIGLYSLWGDLYETHDGGADWSSLGATLPAETRGGSVLPSRLVWTSEPNTLYLSGSNATVYKTTDGGVTWYPVLTIDRLPLDGTSIP